MGMDLISIDWVERQVDGFEVRQLVDARKRTR
jgi:hypothetical protein